MELDLMGPLPSAGSGDPAALGLWRWQKFQDYSDLVEKYQSFMA